MPLHVNIVHYYNNNRFNIMIVIMFTISIPRDP